MHELRQFFATRLIEIVILGVCLQLLTSAFGAWSGNHPLIIASPAIAVFILLMLYLGIKELRSRLSRPIAIDQAAFKIPRKAVVFTLGLNSHKPGSVVDLVVSQFKPQYVGFLGSPTIDDAGIVRTLCEKFSFLPERVKAEFWDPIELDEGRIKTLLIIDWLLKNGLTPADIVLDFTGGTATMSIAAFMAAEQRNIDSQYIYSEWDSVKNQPRLGTQRPILLHTEPKMKPSL